MENNSRKSSKKTQDYILPEGHEWKVKEETSALYNAKYLLVFTAFIIIINSLMSLFSPTGFDEISSVIIQLLIAFFGVFQIYVAYQLNTFDPKLRWYLLLSTIPVLILDLIQASYFALLVVIPYLILYYLVFFDKSTSRNFKTKNYMIAVPIEAE